LRGIRIVLDNNSCPDAGQYLVQQNIIRG
jgi:hypothetical protein